MNQHVVIERQTLKALSDSEFRELLTTVLSVARQRRPNLPRRLRSDSEPARLAQLQVGQSTLFAWSNPNRLGTVLKRYARLRLDEPGADWSGRTTTKGVRVTRIA